MIGNDIVDLKLAKEQSNWRRSNYLEKIFTIEEQNFIRQSKNPEIEVWKLWSRKEAVYKIYNRQTGIRGFFPWKIACAAVSANLLDIVTIDGQVYYTKTTETDNYIYSVAVQSSDLFDKIIDLNIGENIIKINDLPYIENSLKPASITHHGRFERKITLIDS